MIEKEIVQYFLANWFEMDAGQIREYLLAVANNRQHDLRGYLKEKVVV